MAAAAPGAVSSGGGEQDGFRMHLLSRGDGRAPVSLYEYFLRRAKGAGLEAAGKEQEICVYAANNLGQAACTGRQAGKTAAAYSAEKCRSRRHKNSLPGNGNSDGGRRDQSMDGDGPEAGSEILQTISGGFGGGF